MLKEINLAGVYVSPFVGYLVAALIIFWPLRMLFDRWALQRYVWHRPLFDLSVFVIILSLIGPDVLTNAMTTAPPNNFLKRYLAADAPPSHRYLATGLVVLIAGLLAWALWYHFFRAPWTRDGRVRVEVVSVAAQINGQVIRLNVDRQPEGEEGRPPFRNRPDRLSARPHPGRIDGQDAPVRPHDRAGGRDPPAKARRGRLHRGARHLHEQRRRRRRRLSGRRRRARPGQDQPRAHQDLFPRQRLRHQPQPAHRPTTPRPARSR